MKKILSIMIPAILLASCQNTVEKVPAIDTADMDLSVKPGENFYKYANGGWQARNPLKAEYSRYGSFDQLAEKNEERINEMFQEIASRKCVAGSVEQKIAGLYRQGLDSTKLNSEGGDPVKPYIASIYASADKASLAEKAAELALSGNDSFFNLSIESDMKDSGIKVLYLHQGGLGMSNRDYYIEEENDGLRQAYKEMLVKLGTLSGISDPEKSASNAFGIEDALARASWSNVECRDVARMYNPMDLEELAATCPAFDFVAFFKGLGIEAPEKIIVCQPSFFKALSDIISSSDIEVLQDYVAMNLMRNSAEALSDEWYAAVFDFYSRRMRGITEPKPRWKRAMNTADALLGEAVGQMYVKKYFPESHKNRVLGIVSDLQKSLGEHIDALEWMSDSTKAYAREKLAAFTVKIGYPDKWKDYSTLCVNPESSYFENIMSASVWSSRDQLSKIGKETDRGEWYMTPQTVNAYYEPTSNEICFPAAILQPPFFNADADDAVNYGAIGVVIGHEMTHGFDDQGRLFDKDGNMRDWWTEEDSKAFNAMADKLVAQFDKIEILPGLFANGRYTLGENIADQGGVGVAFTALQNSFAGKHPADIDGLSAEQRFFIGYAHVWAGNITEEEMTRRTKMDVHSLSVNRVNATLRNFQTFFDAFSIVEGDAMWRPEEERVMIW